jgi:hypothetical protein
MVLAAAPNGDAREPGLASDSALAPRSGFSRVGDDRAPLRTAGFAEQWDPRNPCANRKYGDRAPMAVSAMVS